MKFWASWPNWAFFFSLAIHCSGAVRSAKWNTTLVMIVLEIRHSKIDSYQLHPNAVPRRPTIEHEIIEERQWITRPVIQTWWMSFSRIVWRREISSGSEGNRKYTVWEDCQPDLEREETSMMAPYARGIRYTARIRNHKVPGHQKWYHRKHASGIKKRQKLAANGRAGESNRQSGFVSRWATTNAAHPDLGPLNEWF